MSMWCNAILQCHAHAIKALNSLPYQTNDFFMLQDYALHSPVYGTL